MRKVLCVLLAFVSVSFCFGQSAKKVLDQASLNKFLADMPKIMRDSEKLASQFGDSADEEAAMAESDTSIAKAMRDSLDKVKKDPSARKAIGKYGWDDRFWDVYYALMIGVFKVSMDQSMPDPASAPPEVRAMLDDLKKAVHPDDIALVRKNLGKIKELFGN